MNDPAEKPQHPDAVRLSLGRFLTLEMTGRGIDSISKLVPLIAIGAVVALLTATAAVIAIRSILPWG